MLAHVAGFPVEEALLAAPALLAGMTMTAGYIRSAAARARGLLAKIASVCRYRIVIRYLHE